MSVFMEKETLYLHKFVVRTAEYIHYITLKLHTPLIFNMSAVKSHTQQRTTSGRYETYETEEKAKTENEENWR